MKRNVRDYIVDILNECDYLISRTKKLNYNSFLNNEDLKKAFVRSLEVIGEAVKNIPDEIREQFPVIMWKEMAGMRDKLIHAYFGVDYEVVWKTVVEDIPAIKKNFTDIINKLFGEKNE